MSFPDASRLADELTVALRALEGNDAAADAKLAETAETSEGRRVLVRVVARTDVSDPMRLGAVRALRGKIEAEEAVELARAAARQRPRVAMAVVEVLADALTAEALFAFEEGVRCSR